MPNDAPVVALESENVDRSEIRLACTDETRLSIIDEVHGASKQTHADLIDGDGARVKCANGPWLLRASNTQSALLARREANDEASSSCLKEE